MTWYWWKHWFWITGVITLFYPVSLIETYPITPIYKEYKKDKIIKFPLTGPTDIDHVFDGNDGMPGLIIRDRDNQIPGTREKDIETGNHNLKITDDNFIIENDNITKNSNETTKNAIIHSDGHEEIERKNKTDNDSLSVLALELNRTTKVVDHSLINNNSTSTSNNNNNNNNNSNSRNNSDISNVTSNCSSNNTVSTNSSIAIALNSSQPSANALAVKPLSSSLNTTTLTATKINSKNTQQELNSNYTAAVNNSNSNAIIKTIECESDTKNSVADSGGSGNGSSTENLSEESLNNKTTTVHVDLIHNDDNDDDSVVNFNDDVDDNNNNNNNDKGDDNYDHDDDTNNNNNNDDNGTKILHHPYHRHHKGNHNLENITKEEEIIRAEIERQLEGERGRKSKVLAEYRHELKYINFSSDAKNLLARSAAVSLDFDDQDDGNVSSEALAIQKTYILDAGTISGICLSVLGLCFAITLAGITLYRRRYLNKPQTLSEPDSSGYIDDSTIRDNSDEMYSLDNDSFLNSLEAMTIQNYWTDTVKHTKL